MSCVPVAAVKAAPGATNGPPRAVVRRGEAPARFRNAPLWRPLRHVTQQVQCEYKVNRARFRRQRSGRGVNELRSTCPVGVRLLRTFEHERRKIDASQADAGERPPSASMACPGPQPTSRIVWGRKCLAICTTWSNAWRSMPAW